MASLKNMTAPCMLTCALLLVGCSDDSDGPGPETSPGDSAALEQGSGDAGQQPDAPPVSCAELEQAYLATLEQARACEPRSRVITCTSLVPDRIACGCSTSVNADKAAELAELRALEVSWERKRCTSGPCPSKPCEAIAGGVCRTTPRTSPVPGLCEDLLP